MASQSIRLMVISVLHTKKERLLSGSLSSNFAKSNFISLEYLAKAIAIVDTD